MRKSIKIVITLSLCLISIILALYVAYIFITADAVLQPEKLIDFDKTISVYDEEGNKIEDTSLITGKKSVKIDNLSENTLNAFIASEDRTFYRHSGLNYKRMIKAAYKNAISLSFKEGASTISQQLIKNTHLSNDKNIKRKLKEIKLTKQLEKKYTKKQILEMYLNTIYFGHNCYGLQRAANYYFDTVAENLTLEQSATIVGLLISPNNYSPFKNPEICLSRRNVVLKNMVDCGFIDNSQFNNAKKMPLSAKISKTTDTYSEYLQAVYDELDEISHEKNLYHDQIKIKTYLNRRLQNVLDSQNFDCNAAVFIRTNDGKAIAFKSDIANAKRQIGSTAKPIFVYAPAIDQGKLHLFTKINDEKVNFNGYSPENYDKKYHGKVSVTDSIKYSYNIPAVKTLNTLNLNDIENYAKKMNIKLDNDEKNLALALGSMKNGLSLKQLCDAYSTFPLGGKYLQSKFIKEIYDSKGKVIYQNMENSNRVFNQGTCSLINEALCETVKSGTGKKMKSLNFDLACKTGTCGNEEGNTDAYSICYTSDICMGVWLGDRNNMRINVTGGNDCCAIAEKILSEIYSDRKPAPLEKNQGTRIIDIDRDEFEYNQKIVLCEDICPKLNRYTVKCNELFVPTEKSVKFSYPTIKTPIISVNNNNISIILCQTKYYSYLIERSCEDNKIVIYDGNWKNNITDNPKDGEYIYHITPYYLYNEEKYFGKTYSFPKILVKSSCDDKLPDIVNKDWFNQ